MNDGNDIDARTVELALYGLAARVMRAAARLDIDHDASIETMEDGCDGPRAGEGESRVTVNEEDGA